MKQIAVLFVCTANICRSPTAHGVLRKKLKEHGLSGQVRTMSAGTHPIYPNSPPDARAQRRAALRDYDISDIRARSLTVPDFEEYDYIFVMDRRNLKQVESICPSNHLKKVRLLAELCSQNSNGEVPDPYYGGVDAFEFALDLIEDACDNLLRQLIGRC